MKKFLLIAAFAVLVLTEGRAVADDEKPQGKDQPAEAKASKDEPEHFRIGGLAGLGFPRPFQLEAFAKFEQQFGVGLEYSFMPPTTVQGVWSRFNAVSVDGRWFPFKGGFFIGLRAGRQWLDASMTETIAGLGTGTEAMNAAAWFVNPRIGYLYTFPSGITLGIDAGVQLPIGATYERSGPATAAGVAQGTQFDNTLRIVANTLGNDVTPTVDLLQIGFLF